MERKEPVTHSATAKARKEPVTHSATAKVKAKGKAKAKAKAKPKAKAKSTARRTRGARQAAPGVLKKARVMLSKKPPVVKAKEAASSPEPADRPDGSKPELAARRAAEGVKPELKARSPQDSKQQLILNMDKGGSMRLDDPKKVKRKDLKG